MVEILPDDAPAPRLCHLIKWPDFDGYGFNLHAERSNPGQFIGKIDDQSPAQLAGLREGDRIIEVNGVNISNENHRQVVERIKSNPQEAKLLVVDQEADLWYREQDIVVKSSQINVVYIKTPVPRPKPDSPRATNFHSQQQQSQRPQESRQASQPQENGDSKSSSSNDQQQQQQEQQQQDQQEAPADSSGGRHQQEHQQNSLTTNQSLDTGDFNDESIEHDKQRASGVEARANRASPPMSPDSGRGDEEQPSSPLGPDKTLTVEAEINHRRPPAGELCNKRPEGEEQRAANQDENAPRYKTETPAEGEMDEKERIRKLHNKSADSGKSSSPDATSSSSNTSGSHSDLVAASGAEAAEDVQGGDTSERNITPNLSSNAPEADENKKSEQTSEPTSRPANATAATTTQQEQYPRIEDTQVNNNNNNNKANLEDSHGGEGRPSEAMTKITTSSHLQKKALECIGHANNNSNNNSSNNNNNNNNNYSGLNLNMTASQMRELIASRKKFDPKKAQMNIRQKYEIIQQM